MTGAVFAQLQELIESGSIPVGEKLPPETELARRLGVSRPVVREALGGLRAMGLVASVAGRGTYATAASAEGRGPSLLRRYSTDELYEVRSHLELPGARLAARGRSRSPVCGRSSKPPAAAPTRSNGRVTTSRSTSSWPP